MNPFVTERIAWNHCETPYNALVASLLLNASAVATEAPESPLPMERDGAQAFDEAGFATASSGGLYIAVFSGCSQSYPWSEGMHRTGVAGLAQFGMTSAGSLLPVLDHPTSGGAPVISDLPVINGAAPYGRGTLSTPPSPVPAVFLAHSYGGCELRRLYALTPADVFIFTTVRVYERTAIDGLVALPVICNPGWRLHPWAGRARSVGPSSIVEARVLFLENAEPVRRRSEVVTNPRGRARRVELAHTRLGQVGRTPVRAAHSLRAGDAEHEAPRVSLVGQSYLLESARGRLQVELDDIVAIKGEWS
jgi:hypothetical protein